jgi:hypothetical protein
MVSIDKELETASLVAAAQLNSGAYVGARAYRQHPGIEIEFGERHARHHNQ